MKLILRVYELQLKHTFRISRQSYDMKRTLIVELKDGQHSGYGEASENPYYRRTIEEMITDLSAHKEEIEKDTRETPEEFWSRLNDLLGDNTFALCAIDMAFHDLYARKMGVKLYELWDDDLSKAPRSNYTIGIDSIENMLAKMESSPWPIYKIKLGTKDDLRIVQELRKKSDAIFRIDANCAWTVEQALKLAPKLKDLGVEFIEQPLPADDMDGSRILFERSPLPIIADESCQAEDDIEKCYGHFHGVNIKLVKCGGLTPALRMLRKASFLKLKKMVGCMTESSVGITAIAHLLPQLDYVDMDGALLLKRDPAKGVSLKEGTATFRDLPGLGVEIDPKLAIRYIA